MHRIRYSLLATALFTPAIVTARDLVGILGPISPVYGGDGAGTSFTKPDWFPDAQFPLVWGGANEPDTSLSWWTPRHHGGARLDYALEDGSWIHSQYNSSDERGYWIQNVYRPVDFDSSLRGTTVVLTIYPDNAVWGTPSGTESHVIDDNYLVGYAHTEDWNETTAKEDNYARTIYSYDNGKTWKKGPMRSLGVSAIDNHTTPGTPRIINIWQEYQGPGWKTSTKDIAKGVDDYQKESNAFGHGNLYGVSGIVWSRYLNEWIVMFGLNGGQGKNLNFVTTPAFDTYSWAPKSVTIDTNEVPGRGVIAGGGDYPTLLGGFPTASSYPMPFNMEMGQLGWVYNKSNGLSGRAIHFISPVEQMVTWKGADADKMAIAKILNSPSLAGKSVPPLTVENESVADLDDYDADGVVNLIEYATGGNLTKSSAMPGVLGMADDVVHFDYTRSLAAAGVVPVVEWTTDLAAGDWQTTGVSEQLLSTHDGLEEIRASLPRLSRDHLFLRLRISRETVKIATSNTTVVGPVALGGGVSLTLTNSEVAENENAASTWTFTRSGSLAADQQVNFSVGGTAAFPADYAVAGATAFGGGAGSVIIPAGQASATITTTPIHDDLTEADETIVLSAPAITNLADAGNWTPASGTFTGIVDEMHTLNFNAAAGATLNNDIPVTKRIRSINFGAASGDHTINGNRIELEAVSKWLTTGYGQYGINQYAPHTATFNTDLNTRTAALYLRSWDAAGSIVLNGRVDMLGAGGLVVSGPGNVTINGSLVDSGYSDFTTGLPEFVAGVNPGRLIMVGDGTLTLAGDNHFSGRSQVSYGAIRVTSRNALQDSVISIKKHNGLLTENDFKVGGLDSIGNLDIGSHHLVLGNHNRPDCYSTNYTGVISGSGSVTKTDSNVQRLGAVNHYSGGTKIEGGILEIPASYNSAFGGGAIQLNGGTLRAVGTVITGNPVQIGAAGGSIDANGRSITLSGPLSGSGPLLSTGGGNLILKGSGTFTGTFTIRNNVQSNQPNAFGSGSVQLGGKLTLGAAQTLAGLSLVSGSSNNVIDTGPNTLSITGAINVPAGQTLTKIGSGALVWTGGSTDFKGDLIVGGGTFQSSPSWTPANLTYGNVVLNGANLAFQPSGTAPMVVNVAQEIGKNLTINGAAGLVLDRGTASSLQVNIGSAANANALVLNDGSTALVTVANGTASLGGATKLFVSGQADTAAQEIYSPALILAGADHLGDFASYAATDGFTKFSGYTAHAGNFSTPDSATTEIANITADATLSANSYARALRIDGSRKLTLTGKTYTITGNDSKSGVILNNGWLESGSLAFGANAGYIYVGGTDAKITSVISGSKGVIFSGAPGTKVTMGTATSTYGTRLTIAGTTVVFPSIGGMGVAYTPITLDGGGTLEFTSTFAATRSITRGSGGSSVRVAPNTTYTCNGTFDGPGEFHKKGAGTFSWAAAGTSTGATYVDEGILDYAAAGATNGSSGLIAVAAGARANLSTAYLVYFSHNFELAGDGPDGEGALAISGGGKTTGSVTLKGDAKIKAVSGATFAFESLFDGQGHNLDFGGSGRFASYNVMNLDDASLTLSGTPYLSVKTSASITCGQLTTAAGSTLELNNRNNQVAAASISGTLLGVAGRLQSAGPVNITSTGTIFGGLTDTPALFTIDGNLSMDSGATCTTYIKGATGAASDGSGGLHSQLLVTGSGAVNGKLKLVQLNGFVPKSGDEIFVMLRNGGSGNFTTVSVVDGSSTPDCPATPGAQILFAGKIGVIQYNRHSSINLSSPQSGADISIKFQ